MSRIVKNSLQYFSFDVDFFNDMKIMIIAEKFGWKGELIAIKLLCHIYKEGYMLEWTADTQVAFARGVMCDPVCRALVNEVVLGLVDVGFFDKGIYDSFHILTSQGIQSRWAAVRKQRRVSVDIPEQYRLIPDENEGRSGSRENNPNNITSHKNVSNALPDVSNALPDVSNALPDVSYNKKRKEKKSINTLFPPPVCPPPFGESVADTPDTEYRPTQAVDDSPDADARLGFVDHLDEIFAAWNTLLDGPDDPRQIDELQLTGGDRFNLGDSWSQFPDVETFRKAFAFAIREDTFAWTFSTVVRAKNIRLLLTKAKVATQQRTRDAPGRPSMHVDSERDYGDFWETGKNGNAKR